MGSSATAGPCGAAGAGVARKRNAGTAASSGRRHDEGMVPLGRVDRFDAFRALDDNSPASGVNRLTSHHADTVTSCPEYKVTAVRVTVG